ncbi:MAG: NUDIX hydrolase [Candidatus Omnitrophota bacterium]
MPAKPPYRILESRKLYRGFNFQLFKDRFVLDAARHKVVTRELVDHPGAVVILPFVDKKRILLLRQFRYAAKGDLWEIPAGTLEKGEQTLGCAKREIEEETGFRARRWKFLTRFFPAPGISNEMMTLYKAEGLVPGNKNLDHDEWIEHETVSLAKARRMIRTGEIRDAKTIIGVLWASTFDGR